MSFPTATPIIIGGLIWNPENIVMGSFQRWKKYQNNSSSRLDSRLRGNDTQKIPFTSMPHHHNPQKIHQHKKILNPKIIILGLFLILSFITFNLIKNINKNKTINHKTIELSDEIKKLEKENKDLQELIAYFSTSEFLDKEAREKLNMAKPGENIIIIPQEDTLQKISVSNDNNKKNYILWWNYFFNK